MKNIKPLLNSSPRKGLAYFTFLLSLGKAGRGFLFFILFISCNKEEPIPAYIHIDNIQLTTATDGSQGSSSHKIMDAWIYVDDQLVGTFEMPATFPVVTTEGTHTIKIFAGIKENGISETRIPYPFYTIFQQDVYLKLGEKTTLSPSTTYYSGTDFTWMQDFEGSSTGLGDSINTDTAMQIITDPNIVFEKTGCGEVFLTGNKTAYNGSTINKFVLPTGASAVFLELNYNCNTDFNVGIIAYASNGSLLGQDISLSLRPTDGWNKVYVNLSTEISAYSTAKDFGIFFSMLKNPDLSTSYFYLDNVKLVN